MRLVQIRGADVSNSVLPRRAYRWPTGGGELPTPAIWCGWMARSVGQAGGAARGDQLRSGIHSVAGKSESAGVRWCSSGEAAGHARRQNGFATGLRRRQAGLDPSLGATVWSLIKGGDRRVDPR